MKFIYYLVLSFFLIFPANSDQLYEIIKIPNLKLYKIEDNGLRFLFSEKGFSAGVGINNVSCSAIDENKNFIKIEKNKWIKKKDTKNINHFEKNYLKIIKLFLNCKYLWGGKTSRGIDCSALIQIYFYYNRIFFPRDSKDQIKYCKKKRNNKFDKGDIIFWKGHVGICLNKSKFIHAYGPRKKVLIMPTNRTIELIEKTASLKVKKVSNIKKY